LAAFATAAAAALVVVVVTFATRYLSLAEARGLLRGGRAA
jgi:hypothetical protein